MRGHYSDMLLFFVLCGAGWYLGLTSPSVWAAMGRTFVFPFVLGYRLAAWMWP